MTLSTPLHRPYLPNFWHNSSSYYLLHRKHLIVPQVVYPGESCLPRSSSSFRILAPFLSSYRPPPKFPPCRQRPVANLAILLPIRHSLRCSLPCTALVSSLSSFLWQSPPLALPPALPPTTPSYLLCCHSPHLISHLRFLCLSALSYKLRSIPP